MKNGNAIAYILLNSKYVTTEFRGQVNNFLLSKPTDQNSVVFDDFELLSDTSSLSGESLFEKKKIYSFSLSLKKILDEILLSNNSINLFAIINLEELFQTKKWYECLNIDFSLPEGYLYFTYDINPDFGYSSKLIWGSSELMSKFSEFNDIVLQCLSGQNDYIKILTLEGWPISKKETIIKSTLYNLANFVIDLDINNRLFSNEYGNRINNKLKRYLIRHEPSVELFGFRFSKSNLCTFDNSNYWDIRSILKYFCVKKKLRNKIRFITAKDFYNIV
jgi:hypothetical protein